MHKYVLKREITSEQLKTKRKALGLTQKEFADFIGISKPTMERWENSEKPITGPIVNLLEFLTPDYLEQRNIPDKTMPIRMWYMYKDDVCTLIDVDEKRRMVKIKNYTSKPQFRAFGVNTEPSFEDYMDFMESRCFPDSRDQMKLILKDLDLPFYDPFMIIQRTEGRMAEDDFWIKVE